MSSGGNPYQLDTAIEMAKREIFITYGHTTSVGRKTLKKYGNNTAVGTTEEDITLNGGTEVYLTTNGIDTISSSDAADAGNIYIEGMTIVGSILTFVSQIIVVDGQNKVLLTTPLARCTRMRGDHDGSIYAYEETAISAGVPVDTSKIHCTMSGDDNTSLKAGISVASTNYFVMTGWWSTLGKSAGSAAADMRLKFSSLEDAALPGVFYTDEIRSVSANSPLDASFHMYEIVRPNTDIIITGQASSGSLDIHAGFYGFFADIVDGSTLTADGWVVQK